MLCDKKHVKVSFIFAAIEAYGQFIWVLFDSNGKLPNELDM